ncbi:MAG: hypothetical protein ABSC60_10730 [Acidobacteriota bacterium]|jgi:hypothetical protein
MIAALYFPPMFNLATMEFSLPRLAGDRRSFRSILKPQIPYTMMDVAPENSLLLAARSLCQAVVIYGIIPGLS